MAAVAGLCSTAAAATFAPEPAHAQADFPVQIVKGPFVAPAPNRVARNLGHLDRLCAPKTTPNTTDPAPSFAAGTLTMTRKFAGLSKKQAPQKVDVTASADTSGAVGPDHYVQAVNVGLGIFSRDGTLVCEPLVQHGVFADPEGGSTCDSSNDTDTVVLYDSHAGRWLITLAFRSERIVVNGTEQLVQTQCVAVSTSDDPTAGYQRYEFQISGLGPCPNGEGADNFASCPGDYPKLGIWPDGYYLTAAARPTFGNYNGIYVVALERTAMLSGQDARSVEFYLPNPGGRTTAPGLSHMLPGDWDGPGAPPSGSPNPFGQGFGSGMLALWNFKVDWTNPAASTFGVKDAGSEIHTPNARFADQGFDGNTCAAHADAGAPATPVEGEESEPDCIPQPPVGGTNSGRLSALNEGHLMFRLAYRNRGGQESLLANLTINGDEFGVSTGIRWYEFAKSGDAPWGIGQQGTYAPADGNSRWLGSMAMDAAGNIFMGLSVSGTESFPSVHYVGRTAADPPGELPTGEGSLVEGQGSKVAGGSFNDYAHVAVDPTDDCTLWFTSQYYASQADADAQDFSTMVGSFRFQNCPAPAPPSNAAAPSSVAGASDPSVRATHLAATGESRLPLVLGGLLAGAGLVGRRAVRRSRNRSVG